jgi:2-polyprenyl-3-methyl-5-hydroxy-6-metoxy-1,4-benzoquinol methylase
MTPLDCLALYEDAEFYDVEFAARDLEIPFYRKHARQSGGPVLEVACGTGRLTLPIARDGVDITGLDVSRPMLAQARRHAASAGLSIEWVEQDCRVMHFDRTFALVFSATNAMQHLPDAESANQFLQSARRLLRPGGRIILDVFNPNPAKLARPATVRYAHKTITTPTGETIQVEAASEYHSAAQVLSFQLFYRQAGRALRTKEVNMRCFFPEELLSLCRANRLEVINRFGGYDETPFGDESEKQILVCCVA